MGTESIDDVTLALIEQLARKVFEGPAWAGRIDVLTKSGAVDIVTEAGGLLLGVTEHPRAREAILAALRVLAGESASVGDQVPALVADLDVRLADATAKLRELQCVLAPGADARADDSMLRGERERGRG